MQEEELAEKSMKSTLKKSTSATPKRVAKVGANVKAESSAQMQIVNEILKKNPDLLKDNKVNIFVEIFLASSISAIYSFPCLQTVFLCIS